MLHVEETTLKGVYLIKPSAHEDRRGNFYETYNEKEYHDAGLTATFIQDDISKSVKGVLKGMHGDAGTYKLVQCAYGNFEEATGCCHACCIRLEDEFQARPGARQH